MSAVKTARRRKPGAPLLRYVAREDSTGWLYVVDVDGCVFRRKLVDDGTAPWHALARPLSGQTRRVATESAARWLGNAHKLAEHVHVVEDNREAGA